METQMPQPEKPAKKNQTPLIVAGVAVALCCCLLALGSLGFYVYQNYGSSQPLQTEPDEDFTPIPPDSDLPTAMPDDNIVIDEAPIGGLGNDILRNDTWQVISGAAIGRGCDQPIGAMSSIEVLQAPENGTWVEKWTVACQSGDTYAFEVEFILDNTGATFNIASLLFESLRC